MDNEWATVDTILPESIIHHKGTSPSAKGLVFWMFNPPYAKEDLKIRCGICKQDIPHEERHCPNCYPKGDK